ncbi:hypothetical protein AS54_3334 [Bacillus cereus 03BB102]|uniref:Uncharacterized protein n=1 Tax=Bacillus cereus 03BB108 TaxID=451709 RepID=A0AAN0SYT6_BACCE|nr:hypothetical protein AS54_3334 [Bacillus cereus 03BB102]AJH66970.1 hypothetical protein BF32_889 [Bacillus thuringiensis]AJI12905.1 hypothetical protein AK40_1873 [Bacillus cereus 03BB108]
MRYVKEKWFEKDNMSEILKERGIPIYPTIIMH